MILFPPHNSTIDLAHDLVDLASWRRQERIRQGEDCLRAFAAYAQDHCLYDALGHVIEASPAEYEACRHHMDPAERNRLVNKFGLTYAAGSPLLLHRRLADVLIDSAIDLFDNHGLITVTMDALRTYDAGTRMQENRPDLVASGMLAKAGTSAHNRALAVDTKLFCRSAHTAPAASHPAMRGLCEADEHGHLDDEQDMRINSRFYTGPMSDDARNHRLLRLQAWQRASVARRLPVANLLAEFWDDRVPGSPADMWRVAVCRALCLGMDANPAHHAGFAALKQQSNDLHGRYLAGEISRQALAEACQQLMEQQWPVLFTSAQQETLERLLGASGGAPPPLTDYLFHEWLETITDNALKAANFPAQCASKQPSINVNSA